MQLNKLRAIKFEEFPDYTVYLMNTSGLKKSDPASCGISAYGFYGRYSGITDSPMMAVKDIRKISDATGIPKEGDKLKIDHTCKIPVTLLKPRYKIITSRSPQAPDFTVVGHVEYPSYQFKIFVSDKLKQVLCIHEWSNYDDVGDCCSLGDYQWFFHSNIDEFFNDYKSFHPYSNNVHDKFYLLPYSKGLYDFCNRILPDNMFVSEETLVTGTNVLTSDMFCSLLAMMDSRDNEICESAILSLASSDYSKCRNVVGYLLSKYHLNAVKRLKSKSTAVKWMTKMCNIEKWRNYRITPGEFDMVKDYLEKTSNGKLTFNDEARNIIHCTDVGFLKMNHDLVKKVSVLSYDLETANLIANAL